MCGEKTFKCFAVCGVPGSPPRVRGKAQVPISLISFARITPACAGKSQTSRHRRIPKGDHPRVCGEKVRALYTSPPPAGSPPRVRGKVENRIYLTDPLGITPACAGKSNLAIRYRNAVGDHPRVCGEKVRALYTSPPPAGSPPRVRGKVENRIYLTDPLGITPACAGKSNLAIRYRNAVGDHPRVCGEKAKKSP